MEKDVNASNTSRRSNTKKTKSSTKVEKKKSEEGSRLNPPDPPSEQEGGDLQALHRKPSDPARTKKNSDELVTLSPAVEHEEDDTHKLQPPDFMADVLSPHMMSPNQISSNLVLHESVQITESTVALCCQAHDQEHPLFDDSKSSSSGSDVSDEIPFIVIEEPEVVDFLLDSRTAAGLAEGGLEEDLIVLKQGDSKKLEEKEKEERHRFVGVIRGRVY